MESTNWNFENEPAHARGRRGRRVVVAFAGVALLLIGSSSGCASSPGRTDAGGPAPVVSDRVTLEQVVGVALADPAVHSSSTSQGFSAWATLELRLEQPEAWRGKILRLVSSEDFAVKAGDRVQVDLRGATLSRLRDGGLEVSAAGVKGIKVLGR